ncbi:MAG: hypothetical protein ACD_80C00098G0008, partial [uncultured bacterium (gcode 4)]
KSSPTSWYSSFKKGGQINRYNKKDQFLDLFRCVVYSTDWFWKHKLLRPPWRTRTLCIKNRRCNFDVWNFSSFMASQLCVIFFYVFCFGLLSDFCLFLLFSLRFYFWLVGSNLELVSTWKGESRGAVNILWSLPET